LLLTNVPESSQELDRALAEVVLAAPWLVDVLKTVRALGPPGAFVAAGAVRDTVWDALTGRRSPGPYGDIDVVYWAEAEPEGAARAHEARLRTALPHLDWELTNQATVHLWHARAQGLSVAPHGTVAEGLATWPETATAVGVRLTAAGELDVVSPFGLADLFALRLRYNPALVGPEVFRRRVEAKRWLERWPELTLIGPPEDAARA
jgi:hypothetical protein